MQIQKGMSATENLLSVLADPAKSKAEFERLEGIRVDAEAAIAKAAEAAREAEKAQSAAENARREAAAELKAVQMLSEQSLKDVQQREAALLQQQEELKRRAVQLEDQATELQTKARLNDELSASLAGKQDEFRATENRLVTWEKNLEVKELDLNNKLTQLRQIAS